MMMLLACVPNVNVFVSGAAVAVVVVLSVVVVVVVEVVHQWCDRDAS